MPTAAHAAPLLHLSPTAQRLAAGLDWIMVLPPSSWRQADAHRASAFRWVRVPVTAIIKASPQRGLAFIGAGDRTRTGTPSLAADFESATSTISSHRQVCFIFYLMRASNALRACRCPVAVPEIFCSLFAHKISTAAPRSAPFLRHRRRSPHSPDSHRYAVAGGGFASATSTISSHRQVLA